MTLDEFRAWARPRCKTVDYLPGTAPCLVWQGATINSGRDPRAVVHPGAQPTMVRREAWAVANPTKPLGKDAARPECECVLCVEPTHMRRVSPSEFRSVPKSMGARLNMQLAARASRSKVKNPEAVVPLVLADTRPARLVAADLGLGKDVVWDIRRGKWSIHTNNPFAQLMR
jgi:hypothetical protein